MQQQPQAPRSSSEVAAIINRLPIEEYLDRDQLAALSARELKVGICIYNTYGNVLGQTWQSCGCVLGRMQRS